MWGITEIRIAVGVGSSWVKGQFHRFFYTQHPPSWLLENDYIHFGIQKRSIVSLTRFVMIGIDKLSNQIPLYLFYLWNMYYTKIEIERQNISSRHVETCPESIVSDLIPSVSQAPPWRTSDQWGNLWRDFDRFMCRTSFWESLESAPKVCIIDQS